MAQRSSLLQSPRVPRIAGFLLGLTLLLVLPCPAAASLYFAFDPASAPPGEPIVAHTIGDGAFGIKIRSTRLPAYLLPRGTKLEGQDLGRAPSVSIGDIIVDSRGDGSISFVVPDLAAGEYQLVVHCEPCRQFGFTPTADLTAGSFSVSANPPNTAAAAASTWTGTLSIVALVIGFAAFLVCVVFISRGRRSRG